MVTRPMCVARGSSPLHTTMEKKFKHGTKEYWMDWYWNRGGREKVQAKRYIAEYERERAKIGSNPA